MSAKMDRAVALVKNALEKIGVEAQEVVVCLRCGDEIAFQVGVSFCAECKAEEDYEESERSCGPQTLADVGMCEADFR